MATRPYSPAQCHSFNFFIAFDTSNLKEQTTLQDNGGRATSVTYHMRNGIKTLCGKVLLTSGVLVFMNETCKSCNPH